MDYPPTGGHLSKYQKCTAGSPSRTRDLLITSPTPLPLHHQARPYSKETYCRWFISNGCPTLASFVEEHWLVLVLVQLLSVG